MIKTVWLSYDLGLRGDYEGLYYWLDLRKGRECGDNIAVLKYDPKNNLVKDIKKELKDNVKFGKGDRVYIIYKDNDKIKGEFIIGKRKPAPWAGYAPIEGEDVVDEE